MERRMKSSFDQTDKPAGTTGQSSSRDWTRMLYNLNKLTVQETHGGNISEADQERTSSSRDHDEIEPDADGAFSQMRQEQRRQDWQGRSRDSSVTSEPSDSPGHWRQSQGSEAEVASTSEVGELKGVSYAGSAAQRQLSKDEKKHLRGYWKAKKEGKETTEQQKNASKKFDTAYRRHKRLDTSGVARWRGTSDKVQGTKYGVVPYGN